jgi:hypothetical protein
MWLADAVFLGKKEKEISSSPNVSVIIKFYF